MRFHRVVIGIVSVGLLAVAGVADAQTKLVLGHSTPTTDPCHQSALIFAKEFEKLTKGKYVVEVYPADQLGKYDEQMQALRRARRTSSSWTPTRWNRYDTLAGLHVYPSCSVTPTTSSRRYRGPVGADMFEQIRTKNRRAAERAPLRGYRELTTVKRAVNTLDDLKGLKIRVPPAKIFVETWKTLGANPTPMVWARSTSGSSRG